ncbi:replication protein [Cronobacter sakazakii]|uniref:replication protein n=1 Tax=Cronobacter sakazakii TaxID=28141 RepID=UPI0028947609|nr:replication protein [Cronobacter sakazakii]EIZ9234950.1 replication protein [Cronobacter sakazakii]MDT3650520.1 replication protein [Cronobacter sakazakii]
MGVVRNLSDYRPSQEAVERKVASLDDGFMRIATSIGKLKPRLKLAGREHQVFDAVIYCTFGWNKSEDKVTNTYLADVTGLDDSDVAAALNVLAERKIINLRKVGGFKLVSVNVMIDQWVLNKTPKTPPKMLGETTQQVGRKKVSSWAKVPDTLNSLTKDNLKDTQTHEVGLSDVVSEKPLTPRQLGTNPRATGTNPRAKLPAFDRERLKETWNCKAERFGLPKIRSVTTTVENGIKRLWVSYLKQCKELKREPKDIDSLLNGYLEHGYQPTPWAMGQNPEGKRYGIETALRQEKIDQILGADS